MSRCLDPLKTFSGGVLGGPNTDPHKVFGRLGGKSNMVMKKLTRIEDFLSKFGIVQPAMSVYQRVPPWKLSFNAGNGCKEDSLPTIMSFRGKLFKLLGVYDEYECKLVFA